MGYGKNSTGNFKRSSQRTLQTTSKISAALALILGFSAEVNAGTASLSSISASPTAAVVGQSVTATIRMSDKCPSAGCLIYLSSNSSAAVTPTSIVIPKDSTSGSFTFKAGTVSAKTVISLSAKYNTTTSTTGTNFSISSFVAPSAALLSLQLERTSGYPGESNNVMVQLSAPCALASCAVSLSNSNASVVALPASVSIPQGASSAIAGFVVGTPAANATNVTVTANYGGKSLSGIFTANLRDVPPPPAGSYSVSAYGEINLSISTVRTDSYGYEQATRHLNMSIPVPYSTLSVYEQCRIDFPGLGQLTPVGGVVNLPVRKDSYNKWYKVRQDFICSPGPYTGWTESFATLNYRITMSVGEIETTQVCLTETAPAAGVVVKLSSSSTAAGIPTSVSIPAGSRCTSFNLVAKSASGGSVRIYATLNGFVREIMMDGFY
jgi:hypothetical protein